MKKTLITAGAALAATALVALGTVSPAAADVTVTAPIVTADTGTGSYADYNYEGYGVAVARDGSIVAVAMEYAGVTIYNVAAGTTSEISMTTLGTNYLGQIALSPDNAFAYVANYDAGEIIVLDLSDNTVDRRITIPGSSYLWMVEVSQDGNFLFVSDYDNGDFYKVDLSDDSVSSAIAESSNTDQQSMCVSTDGTTLYIPDYSDGIQVIDVASWSETDVWNIAGASELYSCELDNDGNLIVGDYGNTIVFKLSPTDGSILDSIDLSSQGYYIYSAVPACDDKIYIADENTGAIIPTVDATTFEEGTTINVDETAGGDGFYGVNADRSADGSVIAISGYFATDGLVVIKPCEAAPELPNTGVDTTAMSISASVALGMLIVGAIALVAIRRRNA